MHDRLLYSLIVTLTSVFFQVSYVCGQPTTFETAEQKDATQTRDTYSRKNTKGKNLKATTPEQNVKQSDSSSVLEGDIESQEDHTTESIDGSGVTVGRVALEALGGLGGILVSLSIGMSLGLAIFYDKCEEEECGLLPDVRDAVKYGLIISGGVTLVTVPLGVYLVGDFKNGMGGFGWTMLGHATGAAIGWSAAIPLFVAREEEDALVSLAFLFAVLSQLTGAVLGYELSSDDNYNERKAEEPSLILTLKPTVSFVPNNDQAVFGITGRFYSL